MFFEILGPITGIETIAQGRAIRERKRLTKVYGRGRWRKRRVSRRFALKTGQLAGQKFIGMKRMASVKKSSKSSKSLNRSSAGSRRFVVCVENASSPASLEVRKLYQVVPDARAAKINLIRVIDESGEDYLYPADHFVSLKLPHSVGRAVLRASAGR